MIELEVYHTQERRDTELEFPCLATGNEQWLGDGFYFWQDYEFANWWGQIKKCGSKNKSRQFCIFKCLLSFNEDQIIDTVFDEQDYYNFVTKIETFAKRLTHLTKAIPTLEEFNDFTADYGLWKDIKVIRFQDVPPKDEHVEVKGFYYKKRIQLRVNDPQIISKFTNFKTFLCVK